MTGTSSEQLLRFTVRSVTRPLGELAHVAAVYLGIAALVALMLGVAVPSVREQARQVHEALLVALQPESVQGGAPSAEDSTQYSVLVEEANEEAEPAQALNQRPPSETRAKADAAAVVSDTSGKEPAQPKAAEPAVADAEKSAPALQQAFIHEVKSSTHGLDIRNVSRVQAQALRSYIARKYKIASNVAGALVKTAFHVGYTLHLDPQLLLAVIAIESRYNPYAESHVGAQGLMQVMTKVHLDKFDRYGEGVVAALNPIANIRVGAQILDDCIKRRGSVQGGLACYVGSTGVGDGGYGAKVLAEQRRLALASGIPVTTE